MDIDAEVSKDGLVTIRLGLVVMCTCGSDLTIHASSTGTIKVDPCKDCMSEAKKEGIEAMNPDY